MIKTNKNDKYCYSQLAICIRTDLMDVKLVVEVTYIYDGHTNHAIS